MDFAAARKHMVDSQVRTNDVTDLKVQRAFETVERERYLPAELRGQAYVEKEIVYAPGRAMATARDLAKLLAALDVRQGDLVLDTPAGSGYSGAILAALGEMVVSVESEDSLMARAQENWAASGVVNAAIISGDPAKGAPGQGPFDVILVGGAIETEPTTLLGQLKDGGRLGAIVRNGAVSRGTIWRRSGEAVARHEIFDATARHVTPGFTRPKAFVF